jgi:membrane associated rhomboid family serine protease
MMAAAIRFVFQRGGPLSGLRGDELVSYRIPAPPLLKLLRDPRVLIFLLMWFGLNFLFGEFSSSLPGAGENIAWEAHIGGFLAGLFGFAALDPVEASTAAHEEDIHQTEVISEDDQS